LLSSLVQNGQCTDDSPPQDVVPLPSKNTTIEYSAVLTTILSRHFLPALPGKSKSYVET